MRKWSAATLRHVGRLSAPGARLATFSVAGDVRRRLEAAGFAVEKKPGFGDMVGRAKYDAWAAVKGKSADDAMQAYVDLIEGLK